MFTYNKIAKHKNIVYYVGKNRANSAQTLFFVDLHRLQYHETEYNEVVAWVTDKTKEIVWNDDVIHLIDKNIIKNYVVICL